MKLSFLAGIAFLLLMTACGSTPDRQPARVWMISPEVDSKAHPGAYITDRLEVPKKIQAPTNSQVPFFFKSCTREVGEFFFANSRYDCDYP